MKEHNKEYILTKDSPLYKMLEKAEEEFRRSWLIKANKISMKDTTVEFV